MGDRRSAIEFYNAGVAAYNKANGNVQDLTTAYQLFSSAAITDPTFFLANYNAGNNNAGLKKHNAAIANLRNALNCECTDEERAQALALMGWELQHLGRIREAADVTLEALELNPKFAGAWNNMSIYHSILCNHQSMLDCARRANELAPDDLNTHIALAFSYLQNGRYAEGLKWFEARFPWRLKQYLNYPYPKWDGENDKTVIVMADQGLGDTLSYARFIERVAQRCKYVHLYIQPPLYRLFAHAFLHLKNVNLLPAPQPFPAADFWTTFVSLPHALRLTDDEIINQSQIKPPHIHMPESQVRMWKVPDKKLHIGISWSGSPANDINLARNVPFAQFLELYQVEGVQLYGLQKDDASKELHEAGAVSLCRDLSPFINDVCDTCTLLSHMDMVITCESALGHIAALADKECWIPYSYCGKDYRIGLVGDNMLWTPKHRVFLQQSDMRWDHVFDKIIVALREKINARDATGDSGSEVRPQGRQSVA